MIQLFSPIKQLAKVLSICLISFSLSACSSKKATSDEPNKKNAAGCLVIKENKALVIFKTKNEKEVFGMPGGKVEPGETYKQAARRETLEESGFNVEPEELIKTFQGENNYQFHLFNCTLTSDVPKNTDGEGIVSWIDLNQYQNTVHWQYENQREDILKAFNRSKQ